MSSFKIMIIGLIFVLGWFLGFLFIRQIVFNFKTAFKTLERMKSAKEDLIIYDNAKKYTVVSVITCFAVLALFILVSVILFLKTKFFDLPLFIAFLAGILLSGILLIGKMGPEHKKVFESFCMAYYRFVPDDQLRTDMYNVKFPAMKLRCHDMGVSTEWIPEFVKEKD